MKTVTPSNKCPNCNYIIDRASSIDSERKPTKGDLSVCFNCGTFLIFNRDLTVSMLSHDKFTKLDLSTKQAMLKAKLGILEVHQDENQN